MQATECTRPAWWIVTHVSERRLVAVVGALKLKCLYPEPFCKLKWRIVLAAVSKILRYAKKKMTLYIQVDKPVGLHQFVSS